MSVPRLPWIRARARRTPTDEALAGDGGRLSFAELAARAERAAAGIAARGLGPGDRVAVRMGRGVDAAVALHAGSLLGLRIAFLNGRLSEVEVRDQRGALGPHLWLDGEAALAEVEASGARPVVSPPASPADVAWVLFTSGTSGRPKAAALTWSNLACSARACMAHLASAAVPGPGRRWLACLPLFHVGGLSVLVRSVLSGAPVTLHDAFDPERVSESLDREEVAFVSLVPTTLRRLLDARGGRPAPPGLRAVLLGGAAAPAALVCEARALGFPVMPTYGLTETTAMVATATPQDPPASVGRALPGACLRIVDAQGSPLAAGDEGEIVVRGPTVFAGYLGPDGVPRDARRAGWLSTADIGVLDGSGRLRVLDRREDLVVSGGENVYPAEVEAVLLSHPDVAEAAVTGLSDRDLGQRVVAWVVPRPGPPPRPDAIQAFCRSRIAGYKVPRVIHLVASLPRNSLGKLARRRLTGEKRPELAAHASSQPRPA